MNREVSAPPPATQSRRRAPAPDRRTDGSIAAHGDVAPLRPGKLIEPYFTVRIVALKCWIVCPSGRVLVAFTLMRAPGLRSAVAMV